MIDPDLLALIAEAPADSLIAAVMRDMEAHVAGCRLCPAGQAASCPAGLALAHSLASAAAEARAAE